MLSPMIPMIPSLAALCASWIQIGSPVGIPLRSVAWTGSSFLAAGDSGTILSSSDGSAWVREESGTRLGLKIAKGNDTVRAIGGDSGTILISKRGGPWVLSRTTDSQAVVALAIGPRGTLVSHIGKSNLWTGTIDSAWHGGASSVTSAFLGIRIRSIVWKTSGFVAVGSSNLVYVGDSTGQSWSATRAGSTGMDALACDLADCIATSNSYDGSVYGTGIRGIRLQDGVFNSISAQRPSNSCYRALDADRGRKVVVGDSGLIVRIADMSAAATIDSVPVRADLYGVAIGDSTMVAVGDGGTILRERFSTSNLQRTSSTDSPRSGRLFSTTGIAFLDAPAPGAWMLELTDIRGRTWLRQRIRTAAGGGKIRILAPRNTLFEFRFHSDRE